MAEDYISRMRKLDNQCRLYIYKAAEEYAKSGDVYTKKQCEYLQEAANLRSQMAKFSVGEERLYQQRKLAETNRKIREIMTELDLDISKPSKAEEPSAGQNGAGAKSSADDSPSEEEVKAWFKDAPKHSFEDVSGMEQLKAQLRECIEDTKLHELYEYLGMKQLHSFFFFGPPGCGKTYIIEAFAHELMKQGYKYMSVDGSDILSKYVGEAEKNVERLFEEAEKNAPCILFIDEVDGVCKNRSQPDLPVHTSSLTTAFLTAYNKINSADGKVIFIGATNYPDQVDKAMLDRVQLVQVPLPDKQARENAFHMGLGKQLQTEDDAMFQKMAGVTENYNYRDIDRLNNRIKISVIKECIAIFETQERAIDAMRSGIYKLTWERFEKAKKETPVMPKDTILQELEYWMKNLSELDAEEPMHFGGAEPL